MSHAGPCRNHDRPVFIVGCDRSGTTLLRAMLTSHPHIAIPYEGTKFKRLLPNEPRHWRHVWTRTEVGEAVDNFLSRAKVRFWALTREEVLRELSDKEPFGLADVVSAAYGAYARRDGKLRWGDKTTKNTFDLVRIARAFPTSQFVHIVRDGRDVYLSQLAVDWKSRPLEEAATWWSRWVAAACAGEQLGAERYHLLRYEDLLADAEGALRRLCDFLGEPFAPEMLAYHEREGLVPRHQRDGVHRLVATPPDSSRAFRWRKELSPREQRSFEAIAGEMLARFSYEVSQAVQQHT